MIEAAKELYPNAQSIEWNFKGLKVDGVIVDHKQLEARQEELKQLAAKNPEKVWAIEQLTETDLDILRWFESGVEPIGLKKYRDDLRVYYKNLELGQEVQRPILDPRTTLKKIWDVVTLK
jgi:hypothetical protein